MASIQGIAFPFGYLNGEFPGKAEDEQSILDSIRQIIETLRFERVMRPSSGSHVMKLLFSNNNSLLKVQLAEEIKRSLREQEKRIEVLRVNVNTQAESQIVLDIIYKRLGSINKATVPIDRTIGTE
jgi:phage baseplate assembly protein W